MIWIGGPRFIGLAGGWATVDPEAAGGGRNDAVEYL